MEMQKSLLVILVLIAFVVNFSHCEGGFRCYQGNSTDPANIGTIYVPPRTDSDDRCFRYEKPTCTGCTNSSNDCYGGCDAVSIQNATYTWYYGVLSAGVCSDIPDHWEVWKWYRNATCCSSDLCNYPFNGATSESVSILTFLLVGLHAMSYLVM